MRAAFFYGGTDIRVEEVPGPEPGPGEVLVRVRAAGICGSDLYGYRHEPLKVARDLGYDETINVSEASAAEAVRAITDGEGAEVVFEAVGGKAPIGWILLL